MDAETTKNVLILESTTPSAPHIVEKIINHTIEAVATPKNNTLIFP